MENGAFWIGIVAPATAVVVSAYLVWRAVRDERRFRRQDRAGGGGSARRRISPSEGPSWKTDPYAWMDDLEDWEPSSSDWSPEDVGWSPDTEGHGDG